MTIQSAMKFKKSTVKDRIHAPLQKPNPEFQDTIQICARVLVTEALMKQAKELILWNQFTKLRTLKIVKQLEQELQVLKVGQMIKIKMKGCTHHHQ